MLPAMHPIQSVSFFADPSVLTAHAARPGGALGPPPTASADVLLGTIDCEVEDVTASVARAEGVTVRLALRLWPRDITTVTFRQGQVASLSYRGKTERLKASDVTGPWNDGDPDDHVEILAISRHGGDL